MQDGTNLLSIGENDIIISEEEAAKKLPAADQLNRKEIAFAFSRHHDPSFADAQDSKTIVYV